METGLAGSTVLVSGASKGIGRAIAVQYAREGANVAITYNTDRAAAEETARLVREAGGDALVAHFALGDVASAVEVMNEVSAWAEGELNVLINNAVAWPKGFATTADVAVADWCETVTANACGTFALTHAAIPLLRKAEWGRILTISTALVVDGSIGTSAYMAGKAALHGLNRTLARSTVFLGSPANGHTTGEAIRCDGFYVTAHRHEQR